ncbi:MAG: helix-turn-helix transcriptional regulator [Bacteroidota bacterium]
MFNQNRIYRIFRLIAFLKSKPAKTTAQLMKLLETSERTVYRYLDMLRELGFEVEKDGQNYFSIYSKQPMGFIPFTSQEADYLEKLICSSGKQNKLAAGVLKKIRLAEEVQMGSEDLVQSHLNQMIEQISAAIMDGKRIKIEHYISASSQNISHRIVEPVCFTDNYRSLSAYEIKSGENKYFNIERMGGIKILRQSISHHDAHKYYKPDIFGFQGKSLDKEIEMVLSLRACTLLKEEYPMSSVCIEKNGKENTFLFKAKVQSFKAPARFVAGFAGEITVRGSDEFITFLKKKPTRKSAS